MITLIDAPARVDGVQLIGEMVGSGYRTAPSLVRRGDGQILQLTPLLYRVLEAADGTRDCAGIADAVSDRLDRSISESDVRALVDRHLRPLGLLLGPDGSAPEVRRSNPLLSLKPRVAVTDPRTTRRITDPFRFLFRPVVLIPVVVAFLAVVIWVFFERGLGASAYEAFERPHLLLLVFVVTVISGGFHEFGHAAANRYSGGVPGSMGAGLYLVWPAFYTDVTDSYRLKRAGRLRTDLGGLYFNAVVVVLTFIWWWATGWEALLLLVATQILQMVTQLLPLLRFDGYHVLADLAGVPDLYHRIRPTLLGLLPHRWKDSHNRMLTPRARLLITLWVLVTVPLMAFMLYAMVRAVPRLLGSAGSAIGQDAAAFFEAISAGQPLDVAAYGLQVLSVVLPVLFCMLVLGRMGLRIFRGLRRWSHGSRGKRIAAAALGAALIGGLAWAWWPSAETYRPIEPHERGTITALLPPQRAAQMYHVDTRRAADSPQMGAAAEERLSGGQPLVATFKENAPLPTKDNPQLAMVLVPVNSEDSDEEVWVFPFDKPLPPEEGDNQALAVVTEDGSVAYDIAFALVWAEGDEILNVNEAHAYASCSGCIAVAVAFQVVLIMDDARVVAPQNLAVAANYDCYDCITAAIASQLVLSIDGEPGEQQLLALGRVWNELIEFAGDITAYTLTEITEQLEAVQDEIVAILADAPPADPSPSPTPQPTLVEPSPTQQVDPSTPTPTPTDEAPPPTPSEQPTPSETAEPTPTEEPTAPAPSEEPPAPAPTEEPAPPPTVEPAPPPTEEPTPAPTEGAPSPTP